MQVVWVKIFVNIIYIYTLYIYYIIYFSIYPMEFKNHLNGNTCGHYSPVMKTSIHHINAGFELGQSAELVNCPASHGVARGVASF